MRAFALLFVLALVSQSDCNEDTSSSALNDSHISPVTGEDLDALKQVGCEQMNESCPDCLRLGHCVYLVKKNLCVDAKKSYGKEKVATSDSSCPSKQGEQKISKADAVETTTATTPFVDTNTTLAPNSSTETTSPTASNETTTTPATTSATTNLTTVSTTITTDNPNTTITTITSTPETTTTTSTTNVPTTTKATPTTAAPDSRGNKFDGWSFFGGILLTLGLSAIGYVSFRYYKVRTGQAGTTYNRF